jgi:peptidoglycan lytic transglycosylase
VNIVNSSIDVRAALALMSLLLALSCNTQRESPQPSPAAPVLTAPARALSMPPAPRASARQPNTARASYQGDAYAGRRTASGERYDPNALTAASTTLPIGSSVMVTNPTTGHSVKVRINDREPKGHGRSLDLSRHAAEELGMTEKGVARVKVKRVDSEPVKSESPNPP